MPLPIRDGNQSLTTLSTILVSNSHIPAHTVVSLGTQAITDIATAVSGVELGPNTLNALENITVTLGQVTITGGLTDAQLRASSVTIAGTVTVGNSVTVGAIIGPAGGNCLQAISQSGDAVRSVLLLKDSGGSYGIPTGSATNVFNLPVYGTVTLGASTEQIGSVTVGNATTSSAVFVKICGERTGAAQNETREIQTDDGGFLYAVLADPSSPSAKAVIYDPVAGNAYVNVRQTASVTIGSALPAGTNQIGSVTASGTVTANIGGIANSVTLPVRLFAEKLGEAPSGQDTLLVCNSSGMLLVDANSGGSSVLGYDGNAFVQVKQVSGSSVTVGNPVTVGAIVGPLGGSVFKGGSPSSDSIRVLPYFSQNGSANYFELSTSNPFPIAGTVTLGVGTAQIGSVTASISGTVPISISSVTVGNSVTIGSLPAISGTVTVGGFSGVSIGSGALLAGGLRSGSVAALGLDAGTGYLLVKVESALPAGTNRIGVVTIGAGTVTIGAGTAQIGSVTVGNSVTIGSLPAISGTVTASVSNFGVIASDVGGNAPVLGLQLGFLAGEEDYRMVDPINPLPISGTVTANSSNGSLTTRFGSVTTANTAFETSAVTNANRKYLLIQNITTASNVITVGIGFTPTTTQGIQLFSGAGLTFEGSYIPTGAVNLLSSVTASCYTILEA